MRLKHTVCTSFCKQMDGGSGSSSSAGGSGEASTSRRGGEAGGGEPFLLPLMTLSKVKLPTESVPLQIFESR